MKSKRQKHSGAFKAKVAIEALQERESLSELSKKYGIHPNMISRWKKEFLERAPEIFEKASPDKKEDTDLEKLYAKIGQLEMEKEYLKKNLKKLGL
jgi:transposase